MASSGNDDHQLHADGRPLESNPTGKPGGDTGQVGRQGEDVFQVHGQRVFRVLTDAKGCGRRHGRGDHIHFFESFLEILLDQSAHFLGWP